MSKTAKLERFSCNKSDKNNETRALLLSSHNKLGYKKTFLSSENASFGKPTEEAVGAAPNIPKDILVFFAKEWFHESKTVSLDEAQFTSKRWTVQASVPSEKSQFMSDFRIKKYSDRK